METRPAAPFPWDEAMAFGFARLRLAPRDFWSMTPRELAAAMAAYARPVTAPERAVLARLMENYPDLTTGDPDNG